MSLRSLKSCLNSFSLPSYGSSKSTPSRTSDVPPPPPKHLSSPNQERRSSPAMVILSSPQQERRRLNSNPSPVQGRPRGNSSSNLLSNSPTSPNLPRHRAQTASNSNGPGPPVSGGVPVFKPLNSKVNSGTSNLESRVSRHSPSNSTEIINGKLPSPRGDSSNTHQPISVPRNEINKQTQQLHSPRHYVSSREPTQQNPPSNPSPNPSPYYVGLTVTIPEERPKGMSRTEDRTVINVEKHQSEQARPVVTKVFDGQRKKSLPMIPSSNGVPSEAPKVGEVMILYHTIDVY